MNRNGGKNVSEKRNKKEPDNFKKEHASIVIIIILLCILSAVLYFSHIVEGWQVLIMVWLAPSVAIAIVFLPPIIADKIKRRLRVRKNNRRIIRQAKAAGVWDNPKALGGKALELKAWKDFKLKREPGESDKHLRQRYETRADIEKYGF